jgi:ATP-dependent protease HslVU (ClpYQ) ATPase subunit
VKEAPSQRRGALLDALTGKDASEATRESFRRASRDGHLDDKEVEIEVVETSRLPPRSRSPAWAARWA